MNLFGKLLPIHGYRVSFAKDLPQNYDISLSHLYQPLVGMRAIMLYQTLLNESRLSKDQVIRTHHSLMNYLNSSLDIIYEERLKLEAIGLLKTYKSTEETQKVFTYQLISPFTPKQFFNDPMLSELLYHHLGEKMFMTLKRELLLDDVQLINQKEITAKFTDVFTTIKPSIQIEEQSFGERQRTDQLDVAKDEFSLIKLSLKQRLIQPEQVLTPKNKRLISDMMRLYHLTEVDIEKCVLWALTEDNTLDQVEFKAACHDIFKTERNAFIQLRVKKEDQPQQQQRMQRQRKSKSPREQLCELLETISMRQLLEGFTEGEASEKDLKMIGEIMHAHQIKPAVMNVLVHYVLTQSNKKLSRSYLEAIASHWARLSLKTAKEAMDFVQAEIERARKGRKGRQTKRKRQQEVIPEWFKEQKEERKQSAKKQRESLDKDEILALFHKHSSENKKKQG